ncbi:cytochrome b [Vibrio paucivorans]
MLNKKPLTWQTIVLHWIVGLSFIGVFGIGLYMVDLPRGPEKFEWISLHKSIGALILAAALIRFGWRLKEGALPPASKMPAWQDKAAKAVHGILLLATLAMPISGVAMSVGGGRAIEIFGWQVIAESAKTPWLQELGSTIHTSAVEILIFVFVLHVGGAIKHQVIDKDGTISRMLGRS